jgi:GT2 family glycosyltransferase
MKAVATQLFVGFADSPAILRGNSRTSTQFRSASTKENLVPPPGVSVVIVNWNTRDMVLRLLASLSTRNEESAHELELIVVDNDSSDGSVEAIRREYPAVKVVAQTENRGFAGGVNPGVKAATQPFVLLLNSDVETSRDSIEEAARYLAESPEVGVLGPRILSPQRTPQTSAWRDPSLIWLALAALGVNKLKRLNFERYQDKEFTEPAEVDCVSGCAMMIRRELLEELGGFDEDYFMYFEETDFCLRARRHGNKVHHAPVGEFLHEEGGTTKTVRLRTFLDFRRSQILFHMKHGGTAAAIAARGLLAMGSAIRVPPLAVLSMTGRGGRARARLGLHWNGLAWLVNPFGGLVPDVDRSQ